MSGVSTLISGKGMGVKGRGTAPSSQRGAALIIGLLFLLVVILVSISGIQTVALQEKMAGAFYDRNIAFQAAEGALRIGEQIAEHDDTYPDFYYDTAGCQENTINDCENNGLCRQPDKDCPPRWRDERFTQWKTAENLDLGLLGGTAPQYFVEYLGKKEPEQGSLVKWYHMYRVTARGNPAPGRAVVLLQSLWAKPEE